MKSKTIWESASRPLFVRSIWLEEPHEGRGVQHRHFILDYESQQYFQQRRQPLRSSVSPVRHWRPKDSIQHSFSCDLSELSASNDSQLSAENLLQIGSAKIKLQQPVSQQARQRFKLLKFYRRPSLTKQIRKQSDASYDCGLNWKLQEIYSRHSSLQDLQSTLSMAYLNPEERLAERVLNWLDLAGKNGLAKGQEEVSPIEMIEAEYMSQNYEMHKQRNKKHQQPFRQQQFYERKKIQTHQQQPETIQYTKKRTQNHLSRNYSEHDSKDIRGRHHQRDGAKPITIIFNRDGLPVRLNRAARNIDLCTLASSASAARRLAGSLASARLYQGNEGLSYKPRILKPPTKIATTQPHPAVRSSSTSRTRNTIEAEKSTPQTNQKRLHDDFGGHTTQDSKRQLHIFMPSLPKRGMIHSTSPSLLSAGCIGDDSSISLLSQKLRQNCKL